MTRLAFGTGTFSGRVQRELGQEKFTRLVRYAYDHGIRFFETSETYGEMHRMLGIALKGIPRDTYRLMSKVTTREGVNPQEKIDELRKLANTDYFDVMLLHYQHVATWPTDTVRWQDGILEAKSKKVVVGHGASVHGLPGVAPDSRQQVARNRHDPHEPQGHQDGRRGLTTPAAPATSPKWSRTPRQVHSARHGRDQHEAGRRRRIHQSRGPPGRDEVRLPERRRGCVTVGFKNTAEIDEAIENLNLALA